MGSVEGPSFVLIKQEAAPASLAPSDVPALCLPWAGLRGPKGPQRDMLHGWAGSQRCTGQRLPQLTHSFLGDPRGCDGPTDSPGWAWRRGSVAARCNQTVPSPPCDGALPTRSCSGGLEFPRRGLVQPAPTDKEMEVHRGAEGGEQRLGSPGWYGSVDKG